ncbi:hypothetical protein O3P69_012682 [Scylla paramamosain]|uniref:Uncharacterized protein n=1 Tax=Scylla paramamosain TaxID=85552 RepID=A0AAW0SCY3_SCYPA
MYSKEGAGDSGPDRHHTGDYLAPLASVDLSRVNTPGGSPSHDPAITPPLRTPIGSPRRTKGFAIGIFQNTVYGTAAHLPFSYTVVVVLDSLHFSRDTLQSQDECSQLQHDIDKL